MQSFARLVLLGWIVLLPAALRGGERPWVVYDGYAGPGQGKHIVLVSGDEEYRSEEALTQLGRILAVHHGFRCTVLYAIDPKTGEINPNVLDNIPGLHLLDQADLCVLFVRFRNLPEEQMAHIERYLKAGKPLVAIRTSTHAFRIKPPHRYASWDWRSKTWPGGFGKQILGETWVAHHGAHGRESTRGIIAPGAENHPILRGIKNGDIWGPTDVYRVNLPLPGDSRPLVLGQVLSGMKPTDPPVTGKKNNPMMPIAWTKTYQYQGGPKGRVFVSTIGASVDLASEGTRRLLVNACYWAVGLEREIPARSNVQIVGQFKPTFYGFGKFRRGVKPADLAWPRR